MMKSSWQVPVPHTKSLTWQNLQKESISVMPPSHTRPTLMDPRIMISLIIKTCLCKVCNWPTNTVTLFTTVTAGVLIEVFSLYTCPFSVITRRAVLSDNIGLSCSCPLCPPGVSYRWYHMTDDDAQPSVLKDHSQGRMMPEESGRYACRAMWSDGMSLLSNSRTCKCLLLCLLMDF